MEPYIWTFVCLDETFYRSPWSQFTQRMSREAERLVQLRQMGFADVDQWNWDTYGELHQRQLLAVVRNDPWITELE